MNKLIEVLIIIYVGIKTQREVLYNYYIKREDYLKAFFSFPITFIRFKGMCFEK